MCGEPGQAVFTSRARGAPDAAVIPAGDAAGLDVRAGRLAGLVTAADRGEPAAARRWGRCRGLPCHARGRAWPDGPAPQGRAIMTVTGRSPAPVTPPGAARSPRDGAGTGPAGSRRGQGRSREAACGEPGRRVRVTCAGRWLGLSCGGVYGCVVGLPVACGVGWVAGGP